MTVGIAAICKGENPHAIVTSDRMVTVGSRGGVEYEDTESKLEELVENDGVAAAAVGAGVSTYIDQIFDRFFELTGDKSLSSMGEVLEYLRLAYQEEVRATIDNQVLQPYDYTFRDLKNPDVTIPPHIQDCFRTEIDELLDNVEKNVRIALAGVDTDGANVYDIVRMDSNDYTHIGYTAVGSGVESAQLAFIRRDYDRFCSRDESLFTALEAKKQAEERQGVGNETDLVLINSDGITTFDEEKIEELEEELKEIEKAERDARETIINEWGL